MQGGFGACFCNQGTEFFEHYVCRGTILIGASKLSRYRSLIAGTGAVSRYNAASGHGSSQGTQSFDRSSARIRVQQQAVNCLDGRVLQKP